MSRARDLDDAELLRLCRCRDEKAWAVLVGRYENLVLAAALRSGVDRDTALDVLQLVWLELHRSLHRIRNPQALPRWLSVSARRIAYKRARGRGDWVDLLEEELVDPNALPDAELERAELSDAVRSAMEGMGERCRELLRVLFLEDESRGSYRRLAQRTGLAVGSIGAARARCLDRLRQRLEGRR